MEDTMRHWALRGLLLLILTPTIWAQNPCSKTIVDNATKAKAIRKKLLAIEVKELDMDIPAAAGAMILRLKDALAETIDAVMKCQAANADPKAIERQFAEALDVNQPEKPFHPAAGPISSEVYGADWTISVRRPTNKPELIQAEAHFGIECGYDSILMIYEHQHGSWQRLLRWQSKEYKHIGGAFGDFFDSVILPQSGLGASMLVAVAHGTPWCTSRFSRFAIDVLQPGKDLPQVLFKMEESFSRGDIGHSLKATRDGFELRIERSSLDLEGVFTRTGIFRYKVSEGKVERIQPIARNGRDFVDEWLQTDWKDASQWCAPDALQELKRVQSSMKKEGWLDFHYGAVRACSNDSKHFQVELENQAGKARYFQIRSGDNSFTMLSVTERADRHCKGQDIMKVAGGATN
jgi:hypothetical protein